MRILLKVARLAWFRIGPEEMTECLNSAKTATPPSRLKSFFQVFKKGAEFTQKLLKENERLRYQLRCLQEPTGQAGLRNDEQQPELIHLWNKISELERDRPFLTGSKESKRSISILPIVASLSNPKTIFWPICISPRISCIQLLIFPKSLKS